MRVPVESGGLAGCEHPLLPDTSLARRILLTGRVQGVGFRPFVYRLALRLGLVGWVRNRLGEVEIHVQGESGQLDRFVAALYQESPSISDPKPSDERTVEAERLVGFTIRDSNDTGSPRVSVPVDLFACDQCVAELQDVSNRRYQYPFINCTQCGPRFTLIRALPYDRANTTMAGFPLCEACEREYLDPEDRRFHAEPVACAQCGPRLEYVDSGERVTGNEVALAKAVAALRKGKVLAVKGIGGYHLMADAGSAVAVSKLRRNKPRPHKPLAVMFLSPLDDPWRFMDAAVDLNEAQKALLSSPARPILLATRKSDYAELSCQIAPDLNEIGVMLPYSPLHYLLLEALQIPLVATSANISGEPVLTENEAVEQRLAQVAEGFLHHNRPIQRPADDSVFRTIAGKERPLRIGRGYAPLEIELPFRLPEPVLAVGAQMKNTITLAWQNRAVVSPHIGDMDTRRGQQVFETVVDDLQRLYETAAERIICDAHPGYSTSRWARRQPLPVQTVLHHHAHASACWMESPGDEPMLVFTWDGVGYGADGSLWGGETLYGEPGQWRRVASFRPFHLPGGDKAGREPWRSAAALCWEHNLDTPDHLRVDPLVHEAWRRRMNTPRSSAVGRLFDAAAALTGICTHASFEGQGPMQLEAASDQGYALRLPLVQNRDLWISDWAPLLPVLMDNAISAQQRGGIFHATMAGVILQQADEMRSRFGVNRVGLSGGVFQNRLLAERAQELLVTADFEVIMAQRIPVNDAGISPGQVIEYGGLIGANIIG